MSSSLVPILDKLVDCWCERRALGPLRHILQAYPIASGLTDEWQQLYQVLRLLRSQYDKQLPEEEANLLGEAIVSLGQALYPDEYR